MGSVAGRAVPSGEYLYSSLAHGTCPEKGVRSSMVVCSLLNLSSVVSGRALCMGTGGRLRKAGGGGRLGIGAIVVGL